MDMKIDKQLQNWLDIAQSDDLNLFDGRLKSELPDAIQVNADTLVEMILLARKELRQKLAALDAVIAKEQNQGGLKRFFGKSYKKRVEDVLADINTDLKKEARSKGFVPKGYDISVLRGVFKLVAVIRPSEGDYVDPSIAARQQELDRYHTPHMMPSGDYMIPSSGRVISRSEALRRGY